MCLALLPKGFDHSRKDGDHNNDNNDERKVVFNDGYVSKEKAQQSHTNNPKNYLGVIPTTQKIAPVIL